MGCLLSGVLEEFLNHLAFGKLVVHSLLLKRNPPAVRNAALTGPGREREHDAWGAAGCRAVLCIDSPFFGHRLRT